MIFSLLSNINLPKVMQNVDQILLTKMSKFVLLRSAR